MDKEKHRENAEKGLEKIRKQKIEERLNKLEKQNQQVKQQNKELKKEVEQLKTQSNTITNTETSSKRISRRQFLKKAGLGTAGLAALMSPVSALDVRSDSFGVFTEQSQDNPYFSVGNGGPVNIQNTHLDLNNRGIRNVGDLELPQQEPEENKENRVWINPDNEQLKIKIAGNIYNAEIQSTAIPDGVVDDFDEDRFEHYSNTSGYQRDTSTVSGGSHALRKPDGTSTDDMFSASGLPNYPEAGNRVRYDTRIDGGRSNYFYFGLQNLSNTYRVAFSVDSSVSETRLSVLDGGNETELDTAGYYDENTWHYFLIEWGSDGEIIVEIYDEHNNRTYDGEPIATLSGTDTTYTEGGVGWYQFDTGGDGWCDEIYID